MRDDTNLSSENLGLPVEATVDIGSHKKRNFKKDRRYCEASRLVKKEGTHRSMRSGLLRTITNVTLYGDIYSPDTLIAAPLSLERYYSGVGCRRLLSEPFYYKKLGGLDGVVLLHIDMKRVLFLLSFANFKPVRSVIKKLFPRIEDTIYSSKPL